MYTYTRQIFLRDTDATKGLYLTAQIHFVMEALETFFLEKGMNLKDLIEKSPFLLPVVHVEADYMVPLHAGDMIDVSMRIEMGDRSFTTYSEVHKQGQKAGTVKIVQAVVSKETEKSIPMPEELAVHLRHLCFA